MIFYRPIEKKNDFLFCSGDHSRPFQVSKINFLVSKTQNVYKMLQKNVFDLKIDFLIKKSISRFKKT